MKCRCLRVVSWLRGTAVRLVIALSCCGIVREIGGCESTIYSSDVDDTGSPIKRAVLFARSTRCPRDCRRSHTMQSTDDRGEQEFHENADSESDARRNEGLVLRTADLSSTHNRQWHTRISNAITTYACFLSKSMMPWLGTPGGVVFRLKQCFIDNSISSVASYSRATAKWYAGREVKRDASEAHRARVMISDT